MKTFGIILILFPALSFSQDQIFEKEILLNEEEPIMEYQYVQETCTRTESSCQPDGDGGQNCTNYDVQYECGGNQWVRTGSKTIAQVSLKITVQGDEGIQKLKILPNIKFDSGISAENLIVLVLGSEIKAPEFSYIVHAEHNIVPGSSDEIKKAKLTATIKSSNDSDIQKNLKNAKLDNRDFILFETSFPKDLKINLCVSKDRRIISDKVIGCESASILDGTKISLIQFQDMMDKVKLGKMIVRLRTNLPRPILTQGFISLEHIIDLHE